MKNREYQAALRLSVYQLLLLSQAERMTPQRQNESFLTVTTAHGPEMNPGRYHETMWTEDDWLDRAQARALERMGYVLPNQASTHWTLTKKGRAALCALRDEISGEDSNTATSK